VSALSNDDLFSEPPGPDLLPEPKHRLVARLPDPDKAASALADLARAGFPADEVFVIKGDEGIRRIDPAGVHHGLKGRVVRAAEKLALGPELFEEDAAHLKAGGVIVSVPARDPDERERAENILRVHDPSRMRYWGSLAHEDII
jgi:hypothetical protein